MVTVRPRGIPERKYTRREPGRDGQFHRKLARLIELRRAGRTDAQIALLAGMSPTLLSRLLNGYTNDIRLSTLTAILDAIGSTLAEFERS
jgi:transcriptional regulator with XRE-family HTH domain